MGIIRERLNPNKKQEVELEFLLSQLFFYVLFWSFVGPVNIFGSIRFCTDLNRRTVCNRCPLTLTQGCSEVTWLLKVKKFNKHLNKLEYDDNQNAGGALCYFWNANALLFILKFCLPSSWWHCSITHKVHRWVLPLNISLLVNLVLCLSKGKFTIWALDKYHVWRAFWSPLTWVCLHNQRKN